jgi:hypothetical protein
MQIKNALQIRDEGNSASPRGFNSFTQPIQFLPEIEKNDEWSQHNLDWLEWQGIKHIRYNAPRLLKNYKLAKGTIDKSDYIPTEANDTGELVDILSSDYVNSQNTTDAMELKFYPIIPNVVNVLVAEFAKRNTKIDYRAIDEYSYNEILNHKMAEIEGVLLEDAQDKLIAKMVEMGMDPNSEEAQQQMNPDAIKKLPEIEDFYSKTYQTLAEQWAVKQHNVDVNRFKLDELEEIAFRDMLVTDREFWHFKMLEEDYNIELWNPVLTFYHKSPEIRYISQGSWVGKVEMLTISDVIDFYGPLLNTDQLAQLEQLYPVRAGRYLLEGVQNDGSFYNPGIDHDKNMAPSLAMKKHLSFMENSYNPDDVVSWIIGQSEHTGILTDAQMLRVTTAYWKSQRRVGYMTDINEGGETTIDIVDENIVITNNPIYNNKFDKRKNAETLVFGTHIEWIWINQVRGGVKIGPNRMVFQDTLDKDDMLPIYIGIGSNKIGPMRFQFKGDDSLYGCKLPVEGKIFTERNTKSTALVDLMKPAQIGFNLVNNQIADILIDEIGTVIALDQNALPRHSLGEDWGKGNYAKAYVAMKDFSILPLDTSITNTENALNFQHYQTLNLEQSNRLMTRIQMANFFKQQALEVIGITPQRLGQQVGQTDTARAVEQAVVGSYAQTEMYFIQHSDYLMPRVHQMRTDLAQYYHSNKSSIRLQNMISPDERAFFEISGTDLLLVDLNVFCRTNANTRAVMEKIQQIAITNNTSGASIYELGQVVGADSLGVLNTKLKKMDDQAQERAEKQGQREQEIEQMKIQAKKDEMKMEQDHQAREKEKDRRARLMEAEIKAAGYGAQQDLNQNQQSDFMDALQEVKSSEQYSETMALKNKSEETKASLGSRKLDIEEQRLEVSRQDSENNLKIARENLTKSEINNGKRNTSSK